MRLIETSQNGQPGFRKSFLNFRAHGNAVLDMTFSADDSLLATASGDQTCQVIDMPTQQTTHSLVGHCSSVKQVKFQPATCSKVVATSGRDGSIHIWDLRCKSIDRPAVEIKVNLGGEEPDIITTTSTSSRVKYATCVSAISQAHWTNISNGQSQSSGIGRHSLRRPRIPQSRSETSVTAISFLSQCNSNILISGCDAQATVKVWDLRTIRTQSSKTHLPLSTTSLPNAHSRYRHFGLTSLAISGDASRLYTLCKDSTIYVYSTAHMLLGSSSELYNPSLKPLRGSSEMEGLGPLYAFRHPKLKVSTFYVKLALRPAKEDRMEMIASGSSSSNAILFPTDERFFHKRLAPAKASGSCEITTSNEGDLPTYEHGTALVRGHEKEVTGVTWSSEGDLITLSDDLTSRIWRTGSYGQSRRLRIYGETGGNRWGHGWAELQNDHSSEQTWDSD